MKNDEKSFGACPAGKTGPLPVRLRDSPDGSDSGDLKDPSE